MTRILAIALAVTGVMVVSAQTPPEPGATPGVVLTNISKNTAKFASVFPQVAVSRKNPNLVAVAWRQYNLPIDTNALKEDRVAECHVAISRDGGQTFVDRNMMDVLRTPGGGGEPLLWGCNAPWVAIASDDTMYFGGALFTAGGLIQKEPKAGRAGVSVSTDAGKTWSKMVPGITIARLAPGLKGLEGGMEQHHTPWDGANGLVDPQTGTFYSTAGQYICSVGRQGKDVRNRLSGQRHIFRGVRDRRRGANISPVSRREMPVPRRLDHLRQGKDLDRKARGPEHRLQLAGHSPVPHPAASPATAGHYAVGVYQPDHRTVKVYYTTDGGQTWKSAAPRPTPENVPINNANQVSVGYTTDGKVLLTWRGFRNPGAFNTFVAMLDGDRFGPTIKVSPELSIYPPLTYAGIYGNGNGGGDFTTWVQGNAENAFVAFPFAPRGEISTRTWPVCRSGC